MWSRCELKKRILMSICQVVLRIVGGSSNSVGIQKDFMKDLKEEYALTRKERQQAACAEAG